MKNTAEKKLDSLSKRIRPFKEKRVTLLFTPLGVGSAFDKYFCTTERPFIQKKGKTWKI